MATRSRKTQNKKEPETGKGKMECEFRSGVIAGTAIISGATFAQKGLQYADVEGLAMFEGDIVLGSIEELRASADAGGEMPQFSVGITGQQFRWPNATIPYEIDPALPNQARITDAIAHWQANTRIRFVLRTAANAAQYPDFVRFVPGGGCSSMVGKRGGQQNITLGSGCSLGNTIHEIGHAVGLWHEQSREDRNTFVRIEWANIDPAMQHNFSQHISDGDDLGAYDYGSMMHYPATAFSINGQPTIVPLQPIPAGVVMGQRNGLSAGDINGVHLMYPAPPTFKEVRKDPIKETRKEIVKEVAKEITKEVIKDIRKDPVVDTIKEVRKDPIRDTIKEVSLDPVLTRVEGINTTTVENINLPGGGRVPGLPGGDALPFIMASPSRIGGGQEDAVAMLSAQAQELAEAIALIDQQQAELMTAYQQVISELDAIQQGQR